MNQIIITISNKIFFYKTTTIIPINSNKKQKSRINLTNLTNVINKK